MKRISAIITAITCGIFSTLALTGCDALGITITERGIQANTNTLLICTIILIIAIVVVQRLLSD